VPEKVTEKQIEVNPDMYSILLVDDEPDLLAAWHLILTGEGYDVRCATNGAQALECIRQRGPDLVITDWMMPVMDGHELCRRITGTARSGGRSHSCPHIRPASLENRQWLERVSAETRADAAFSHDGRKVVCGAPVDCRARQAREKEGGTGQNRGSFLAPTVHWLA
jgi:CheY-like chemotaxis protein